MLRLGDLLQGAGDSAAAELSYERAGRLDGTQVASLIKRAQLAVQNDQFTKAVKFLESAQAIEPQPDVERYLKQVRRLAEK
jgi:Tfp pilus assembly protein PilF